MKQYVLMAAMLAAPACGWAECQIFTSQQKVTWSNVSPAERQQANGQRLSLPEKQIQVQVVCREPQRIRLFPASDSPQNGSFALGPTGEMRITASQAYVDDKPVRIAPVAMHDAAPRSSGSDTFVITPNQGLALMDGTEVHGKTASVTLTVQSTIRPGSLIERTTWRGNLKIRMDVQ